MGFVFQTVVSRAKVSSNETWGTQLQDVRVEVTMRPFPFKDVDHIRVFDLHSGKEIPLSSLNKFEQENLIEEANAEIKSGRASSGFWPMV